MDVRVTEDFFLCVGRWGWGVMVTLLVLTDLVFWHK